MKNAEGFYSNFNRVVEDHLVTSSYIFAEVIPPGTSSFEFNPLVSGMPTGSFYFRGTGNMTVNVATYSGSYTLTPAQLYGQGILNTFALTPIPDFQSRVAASGGYYQDIESQNTILNSIGTDLLSSASLVITPNAYKEDFLYSVIPSNGSGDFTFTRATTATRVNSDGLVELVPYNLLTYSEDFANGNWVKNEATISSNIATAPNGTTTADKLIENTANDSHHVYQNATANGVNTFSFYAKKGERTFVYAYADSVGQGKCFNLTSGTLGVNIISAPINATIESVGNDWFRCTITVSITSASALRIGLCSADGTFSYLGNGTSGAYIWGAQLVEGTNALPYQKTETRLNIPRLDYSLGGCPNILLEPQRTNLALQSSSFDNASWSKSNSSVTANSTTSPSGITDADTLTADGTSNRHEVTQLISFTSGLAYTFSVYIKKNTNDFAQLTLGGVAFSSLPFANFNVNNGTLGSTGGSATSTITSVGNGWYRCTLTATATATQGDRVYLVMTTSPTSIRRESNTLSTSVYLWGAQLELGSYGTSFIPTTTASVTRNNDVCLKTGASALIGQTEGTIFIDAQITNFADAAQSFITISDGTIFNRVELRKGSPSQIILEGAASTGSFPSFILSSVAVGRYKIAVAYQSGNSYLYINGAQVGSTSANAFAFTSLTNIVVGANATGSIRFLNDRINLATVFQTRLSPGQLATLTTL